MIPIKYVFYAADALTKESSALEEKKKGVLKDFKGCMLSRNGTIKYIVCAICCLHVSAPGARVQCSKVLKSKIPKAHLVQSE